MQNGAEIRRSVPGAAGHADIEPVPGIPGAHRIACSGTVDDALFRAIYAALAGTACDGRLALVVDLRQARVSVGVDGYAGTAAMLRAAGVTRVLAVICDCDPARPLDAKMAGEAAAIAGLAVRQRVAARPQDCIPALLALLDERPAEA